MLGLRTPFKVLLLRRLLVGGQEGLVEAEAPLLLGAESQVGSFLHGLRPLLILLLLLGLCQLLLYQN